MTHFKVKTHLQWLFQSGECIFKFSPFKHQNYGSFDFIREHSNGMKQVNCAQSRDCQSQPFILRNRTFSGNKLSVKRDRKDMNRKGNKLVYERVCLWAHASGQSGREEIELYHKMNLINMAYLVHRLLITCKRIRRSRKKQQQKKKKNDI